MDISPLPLPRATEAIEIQSRARQLSRLIKLLGVKRTVCGCIKMDSDTAGYKQKRYDVYAVARAWTVLKESRSCDVFWLLFLATIFGYGPQLYVMATISIRQPGIRVAPEEKPVSIRWSAESAANSCGARL